MANKKSGLANTIAELEKIALGLGITPEQIAKYKKYGIGG